MELTAAIEALQSLKRSCEVIVHTDSQYLRGGVTGWINGWKSNGWRTAAKKPVKNEDLWRALDAAAEPHKVEWRWVKGHADDELNLRADQLAREGLAAASRAAAASDAQRAVRKELSARHPGGSHPSGIKPNLRQPHRNVD